MSKLHDHGPRVPGALPALILPALLAMTGCSKSPVLEITPAVVRECEPSVAALVRWDVADRHIGSVKLLVNNLGQRPQLWAAVPGKGSQATGRWVADGYTVTMTSNDGRVLARRTVTSVACD
jgi:hypothetical protein